MLFPRFDLHEACLAQLSRRADFSPCHYPHPLKARLDKAESDNLAGAGLKPRRGGLLIERSAHVPIVFLFFGGAELDHGFTCAFRPRRRKTKKQPMERAGAITINRPPLRGSGLPLASGTYAGRRKIWVRTRTSVRSNGLRANASEMKDPPVGGHGCGLKSARRQC